MTNSPRTRRALVLCAGAVLVALGAQAAELDGPATIVYDAYRVPTIVAGTEHDAIFLQGYLHAKDRLFQMDFQRRLFSGGVSELVGPAGIAQDVQLRTLGLRRAAERSLPVQTPEVMAWLEAYADGVNAFLANTAEPLPIEYGALEITRAGIPPWTPLDSLTTAKGLAFGLSFDLGDINRTLALLNFRGVCNVLGCNGLNLYNDDLWRVAPFESAVSIGAATGEEEPPPPEEALPAYMTDPGFEPLVQGYRDLIADIPVLSQALKSEFSEMGSNWWIVSGALTESGHPMLSNDPHLSLGAPATFYEVHLSVTGGINVTGTSFPGTPGVVLGCNDTVCWGASVNAIDVTDVYNEVLLPLNPAAPTTPTHTLFNGVPEPLTFIPQVFRFNVLGDGQPNSLATASVPATSGGVTMVVPRRNNGPIVNVTVNPASPTPITGLAVAYTGWSATHEIETIRRFARASSMQEFKDALQYFDFGSQNWAYADIHGNIAYYTSGELPIREDLQTFPFLPAGLAHPGLIRDGTHTNRHEWMTLANPQPNQTLDREILPFHEMPQTENPPSGYILNANNDPAGTTLDNVSWNQFRPGFNGRLYLSSGYASGERQGRIQRLFADVVAGGGTLSVAESAAIQANNQLLDAEVLTPYLLTAFANATAPGAPPELAALVADPRIGEAIGRLGAWDFSTPTGIDQGFDPGDNPAAPGPPSAAEVDASVAATIYAVWRGQVVQRVIDRTLATLPVSLAAYAPGSDQAMSALRRFLDNYAINGGVGASLINFFVVPGVVDPFVARDIILLESLRNGLNLLASSTMAPAFGGSTNLGDYRWGKLHRIVYAHSLGGPFNIPPAGSPQNVAPNLPGFARAGGRGAVDASSHDARADGLNEFMFSSGPARRVIATLAPDGPDALEVIPGGESGQPGNPHGTDQLALWLVNAYKPLPVSLDDVNALAVEVVQLVCGNGQVGPGEECDDGNANDADGCSTACRFVPAIACGAPSVSAAADTCTAAIACSAIATCTDPEGAAVSVSCDPGGPYGFGTSNVTVSCGNGQDTSVTACPVTVLDVTPPTLSVGATPSVLWPPNHHLVSVDATPDAADACGEPTVTLVSIVSSEPDDAPGSGDGHTSGDHALGPSDFTFALRAERAGTGDGRTYTVTYVATDAGGNQTEATTTVSVPHDLGGVIDPLHVTVRQTAQGTRVEWAPVPDAVYYNVVRSWLSDMVETAAAYDFGRARCLLAQTTDLDTRHALDDLVPPPGEVLVYLIEFSDGTTRSTYGSADTAKPRLVPAGDCE